MSTNTTKPFSYESFPPSGLVAYFSMEIAINPGMPTYSGGLGVLAGDTLRSAADLGVPLIAFTLLHRKGYFRQHLDEAGQQTEEVQAWNPADFCTEEPARITVSVEDRTVTVRAWRYDLEGRSGHIVPIYLLDTDLDGNSGWDRGLTDHLYGGDTNYRLQQEIVLGMGGLRMANALGRHVNVYHMNEGHAALLTLALLESQLGGGPLGAATDSDLQVVRNKCVFTTHTPVPAGHDRFSTEQAYRILGGERTARLQKFGAFHEGLLNMTMLALRFCRYANGVAMQHGKVSREMFPEFPIDAITNGVHAPTWLSDPVQHMLDAHIPAWRRDNLFLRNAIDIPVGEVLAAHARAKDALLAEVAARTGLMLNPRVLTLGFARRVATYKRANLLFTDPERLVRIAEQAGGLQILYAGKAHPQDEPGKALIREVVERAHSTGSDLLKVVYLENYAWDLGAALTAGVDVWVNTPRRPYEASGTSGMKAALNGVPSLSILDGWWIEGCIEGVTGWAIEDGADDAAEAHNLYNKLESAVVPLYLQAPEKWGQMMRTTLAFNGSYFNTNRMVKQYTRNAYYPIKLVEHARVEEAAYADQV
ncbi:alpha-glucan family phosphorylase [Occallatibacter riparius]|uniref:glycogen phosphorylase n=1 Tax=Occallatibacter riparius TaxID=1002689 RepID=A0A9J7BSM8_9BACT|nr:alpha-glucan family phosphorylase [Occallatibacter riparius]UWZ85664.1 alpha-glucan family phosphorylase [Occallatibacter riparius]